jgi:hypothetical protein
MRRWDGVPATAGRGMPAGVGSRILGNAARAAREDEPSFNAPCPCCKRPPARPAGGQVCSVNHGDGGRVRLDLRQAWADAGTPAPITPEDELVCDPDAGWLCSALDCGLASSLEEGGRTATQWFPAGASCLLALHDGKLLVEYDMSTRAPVGLVADATGEWMRGVGSGRAGGGPGRVTRQDVGSGTLLCAGVGLAVGRIRYEGRHRPTALPRAP